MRRKGVEWEIFTRGPLFEAVQALRLFNDSKYYPDMIPRKLDLTDKKAVSKLLGVFARFCDRSFLSRVDSFRTQLNQFNQDLMHNLTQNLEPDFEPFKNVTGLGEGVISFRSLLYAFITSNFYYPEPELATSAKSVSRELTKRSMESYIEPTKRSMEAYIDHLWSVLRRDNSDLPPEMFTGTLIPLDHPYVVAGGRFNEVYYWDAYFTGEGLVLSGYSDLFDCMVKNYAILVSYYGFIPNGNRRYYTSRSQPPFFCSMVDLLERLKGSEFVKNARFSDGDKATIGYVDMVQKEYNFWTGNMKTVFVREGEEERPRATWTPRLVGEPAENPRALTLKDVVFGGNPGDRRPLVDYKDEGSPRSLSKYWDHSPDDLLGTRVQPRPEAYHEDIGSFAQQTKKHSPDDAAIFFRHIRAAAESGWDFSSRWFRPEPDKTSGRLKRERSTIRTTKILPVDLNAMLFGMEKKLHKWTSIEDYEKAAEWRKRALIKYFWNDELGWFFDYSVEEGNEGRTDVWSLAGAYPLFTQLFEANDKDDMAKVDKMVVAIREKFLRTGGVVTTLLETTEQWDYPNGWAPLQWIVVRGLLNYERQNPEYRKLAIDIAKRFVTCVGRTYKREGRILEKYNVCEPEARAGGGDEYLVQEGFGWTNGIVKALMNEFRHEMEEDDKLKGYLG